MNADLMGLTNYIGAMGRGVMRALWPERCPVCGAPAGEEEAMCPGCRALLPALQAPVCAICGRALSEASRPLSGVCGYCELGPPAYAQARSYGVYDGLLARLIRDFKFHGKRSLLPALKGFMLEADERWYQGVGADAVVPVPLHRRRLGERGFNQAADLARPVARRRRVPLLTGALVRVRETEPQYGLTFNQRRENVKGAFQVVRPRSMAGRKILLVDDILTTGVTVNESVKALKKAGAREVTVLTLARTA